MSGPALEAYLAEIDARGNIDTRAARIVRALDHVIVNTRRDFDTAIKYKILMYALHGDWRTWVCAIDVTRKGVSLRFLYGVLLDDPLRVLRAGSSVLKTWDFRLDDAVDPAAVGAYVAEAIARYDAFKANAGQVLEASRSSARAGRPPRRAR